MNHARRTRTVRWLVTVGGAACLWCSTVPAMAQEPPPPSTAGEVEGPTAEPAPQDGPTPPPPESTPLDSETSVPSADAGESSSSPGPVPPATPEDREPADGPPPVEPTEVQPVVPAAPSTATSPGPDATTAPPVQPAPPAAPPPVAPSSSAWSFSLATGYYQPRLGTLNGILRDTSLTMLQDPNFLLPRNQSFPFEQRNLAVDGIQGGMTYGIDTFYNTGGPHSFGLSFSSWRGETFARDTISLFLRSNRDPIPAPRSARYNLILDQIFFEWRYHLFRDQAGKGLYLNAGLVGISLAFFTMDSLVNVVDPQNQVNFASVSSDESFGWGYTTRFGVGGDYPLTSWLSIGGRANYVLGTIRKMTVTRHFLAGFPNFPVENPLTIRPGVPLPTLFFPPRDGVPVQYAPVTTTGDLQEKIPEGSERNLVLELSGWEGLFELTIHF